MSPLEKITFNHFFMETKDKITPALYRMLNPDFMSFIKTGRVYMAILEKDKTLNIAIAVGEDINKDCWQVIWEESHKANFDYIEFSTLETNKKMQTLAKYVGAKETDRILNYLDLGTTLINYKLDLHAPNRRFKCQY